MRDRKRAHPLQTEQQSPTTVVRLIFKYNFPDLLNHFLTFIFSALDKEHTRKLSRILRQTHSPEEVEQQ